MPGLRTSILLSLLVLVFIVAYIVFIHYQTQVPENVLLHEGTQLTYYLVMLGYNNVCACRVAGQLSIEIINITDNKAYVRYAISVSDISESLILKVDLAKNRVYENSNAEEPWRYWINTGNILELRKAFEKCNVTLKHKPVSIAGELFEKYYVIRCSADVTLMYDYETGILLKANNYKDHVLEELGITNPCYIELFKINASR